MHFTASTLAVFGLATIGNAHMIMNTPVPYGKSSLTNSPLAADGSDFPCKQRSGVYDAEGASNTMALGSTQPLSFTGSATHGGGSCQISITYDKAPTKDSVFKVIHSIVGGCPIAGVAGNNGDDPNKVSPTSYSFKIPDNLPTGDATLAWSWVNKIGNREFYMNCAPVTITGSGKRDILEADYDNGNGTFLMERDQAAFSALPNMFVANLGQVSGTCHTVEGVDTQYPDAGSSVDFMGTASAVGPPSGSCASGSGSGSGSDSGSSPTSSAAPAASSPAASPVSSSTPDVPGGVFVTAAPSATATPSATAAPSVVPTTLATSVVAPAPATSTAAPAASPAAGSTKTGALKGACTAEGDWNCIGENSFQRCASGTWSVVQQLASGTKCTVGQSAVIDIVAIKEKRAFRNAHVRRHVRGSF